MRKIREMRKINNDWRREERNRIFIYVRRWYGK
jgi:hypothetical protein